MANPSGRVTHGESKTRTYRIWSGMKNRCNNPNNKRYAAYGGRGIKLDPAWETYEGFVADMGHAPDDMSIDRIDNDGDYTPDNCRWATLTQQARNKGRSHKFDGISCAEWARKLGVSHSTVTYRLRKFGTPTPDESKMRNRLEWKGKLLKEWAAELGVPYYEVRNYYYIHRSLEKLIAKLKENNHAQIL